MHIVLHLILFAFFANNKTHFPCWFSYSYCTSTYFAHRIEWIRMATNEEREKKGGKEEEEEHIKLRRLNGNEVKKQASFGTSRDHIQPPLLCWLISECILFLSSLSFAPFPLYSTHYYCLWVVSAFAPYFWMTVWYTLPCPILSHCTSFLHPV